MISSIFIDRPRLAIVISIVITLGGSWPSPGSWSRSSLTSCRPRSKSPRIQARLRRCSRRRWRSRWSKIVGVDKMIYMKSTSGNDGRTRSP